jgi:hypothetical protein
LQPKRARSHSSIGIKAYPDNLRDFIGILDYEKLKKTGEETFNTAVGKVCKIGEVLEGTTAEIIKFLME